MPLSSVAQKVIHSQNQRQKRQRDQLFGIRIMGMGVSVSNATIASWHKETLTLFNIRASGKSARNLNHPILPAKGP